MTESVTVLIPTKGRPGKLLQCIRSVPLNFQIAIHATEQADLPSASDLPKNRHLDVSFGPESVVASFNILADRHIGPVVVGSDDAEFLPGCLEMAHIRLLSLSPRHLIGLHVVNMLCSPTAFVMVGRALIEERGFLFRPEFEHFFSDTELGEYAKARGVFFPCLEARMHNYHPNITGIADATYRHRRREKWLHDKAVWERIKGTSPAQFSPSPQK